MSITWTLDEVTKVWNRRASSNCPTEFQHQHAQDIFQTSTMTIHSLDVGADSGQIYEVARPPSNFLMAA